MHEDIFDESFLKETGGLEKVKKKIKSEKSIQDKKKG